MKTFSDIFQERANRILALSKIGQIAIEGLSQIDKDSTSAFAPLYRFMADHIPEHYHNHQEITMPEYKVVGFLDGMTLVATISEMEAYFQDVTTAILLKHPEKIGKSSFELKLLLELTSIDDVKQLAAEKYVSEMLFKKPNEYKKDLLTVLSVNEKIFNAPWPIFVEAKARRDIGVHNSWIVNDIYRAKVREVGLSPTTETILSANGRYLETLRASCIELMIEINKHCELYFK
jgi:hypothetical protein